MKYIYKTGANDIATVTYKNRHSKYNELEIKVECTSTSITHKVFILNQHHSKCKFIYQTDDLYIAEEIAKFIETGFDLKRTKFNPPKSSSKKHR